MNAADQEAAALQLAAAFASSGVRFLTPVRDGARITGWLPVDERAMIGRCMAAFGWRLEVTTDSPGKPARILSISRRGDG